MVKVKIFKDGKPVCVKEDELIFCIGMTGVDGDDVLKTSSVLIGKAREEDVLRVLAECCAQHVTELNSGDKAFLDVSTFSTIFTESAIKYLEQRGDRG